MRSRPRTIRILFRVERAVRFMLTALLCATLGLGCAVVPKEQLDAALAEVEKQKTEIASQRASLDSAKARAEKLAKYVEAREQLDAEMDRMVADLLSAIRRGP